MDVTTGREPSMFDVAKLAGVSHQTVSRVLNGHTNVKEATRLRVRTAIAELGYRPNRAARALATGQSRTLGVVAPRSTLYGPASLLAAFEETAGAAGFAVSVSRVRTFETAAVQLAVTALLDQRVSAIAAIVPVRGAAEALADLPSGTPLVTIDGPLSTAATTATAAASTVAVDQRQGGRLATRHLLDAGHSTVWHVSGPQDWFDAAGRTEGWAAVLREEGRTVPPPVPGDWTAASGYRAGQLLGRMPEVDAIFVANDAMALGVLHALHELGRRVPEDVSVVGFDDVPESAHYIPPLTTVRQDFEAVATGAVGVLLEQLEGSDRPADQVVTPTLVERSSVARR
ncbi:LacI family DNA-binding transcriptional regulator [Pseudonocardia sp. TRM90224]|uniref:LacI family DNA-binding transcriptional regulator n=1 Tax=Pseudonocardia sp. TRM90224 TaxID=2812678 RepID=UPI001E5C1510|nr:LacI family DNA-binding transcriptional regulator [Pseudonocardia sp. TRM90224]